MQQLRTFKLRPVHLWMAALGVIFAIGLAGMYIVFTQGAVDYDRPICHRAGRGRLPVMCSRAYPEFETVPACYAYGNLYRIYWVQCGDADADLGYR